MISRIDLAILSCERKRPMNCPQCSSPLPDGNQFCSKCGAALTPEAKLTGGRPAPNPDEPERELWKGRMATLALAHLWILWFFWSMGLWSIYFFVFDTAPEFLGMITWILVVLPLPYISFRLLYGKFAVGFRLTTHRFFKNVGIFSRSLNELELIRVDDVSVYQNLIHRIFDIGTVTIISTDSTDSRLEIYGVEKPIELKEMIRENVRKRRGRSLYMETL